MAGESVNGNGLGRVMALGSLFVTVQLGVFAMLSQRMDYEHSGNAKAHEAFRSDIDRVRTRLDGIEQRQEGTDEKLSEVETQFWTRAGLTHREINQTRMDADLPPLEWIGAGVKENR